MAEGVTWGDRTPTLKEIVAYAMNRDPDAPVMEYQGVWYDWRAVKALADKVNALIEQSGAGANAAISFIPRSHPASMSTLVGLLGRGRTVRMIYAFQSATGIAANIERLKSAIVIGIPADFGDEAKAAMTATGAAGIVLDGMEAALLPGFEKAEPALAIPAGDEPMVQILTSGTTGAPKQFPVKHSMLATHHIFPRMKPGQEAELAKLPPMMLYMPVGNISGLFTILPTLLSGMRAMVCDRFSLKAWHEHVLKYRPAVGGFPPSAVQMILDAGIPPEDLSSIKWAGTGAAPLDPTVHRAFEEKYKIPLILSYGATEFGGPVCTMSLELIETYGDAKFGSVGRAFPGASLRIVDPETGEELPRGELGLLEVISQRLDPVWIRTSDMAIIDEDDFLFIKGRADGAIMRGGFKILPETIERALLLHPSIAVAAVTAVPDRRLMEVPGAAIQVREGAAKPSIEELEQHLRQHVLSTHIPTHWRFVDAMPRNASMKVDKPAVKALFEDVVEDA